MADALPRLRALADALDARGGRRRVARQPAPARHRRVGRTTTVLTGIGVASVLERVGVRPPVRRPYCAPEVALGHGISPAGDQYALAAIAHEWLSGRRISGRGRRLPSCPALVAGRRRGAGGGVLHARCDELPDDRFPTGHRVRRRAGRGGRRAGAAHADGRGASPGDAPRLAFDRPGRRRRAAASSTGPTTSARRPTTLPALSFATLDDSDAVDRPPLRCRRRGRRCDAGRRRADDAAEAAIGLRWPTSAPDRRRRRRADRPEAPTTCAAGRRDEPRPGRRSRPTRSTARTTRGPRRRRRRAAAVAVRSPRARVAAPARCASREPRAGRAAPPRSVDDAGTWLAQRRRSALRARRPRGRAAGGRRRARRSGTPPHADARTPPQPGDAERRLRIAASGRAPARRACDAVGRAGAARPAAPAARADPLAVRRQRRAGAAASAAAAPPAPKATPARAPAEAAAAPAAKAAAPASRRAPDACSCARPRAAPRCS